MFVGPGGKDIIFARTKEVLFNCDGKVLLGKTLKAKFKIAGRSFNGTISPESFARYEEWKQAVSGGVAVSG